ncbi:hypothetical protein [Burkholderia ubonensis]|uniref:hypothetical protein n=1 Tax=Burkholderia ubonensis TaxID=101571 RepID=UPI00075D0B37|nr:hypothetical protein [Burkholderia ubonensis]
MIDAPLGDYRARHAVARVADGPTGGSGDLAFANAEDSATGAQKPWRARRRCARSSRTQRRRDTLRRAGTSYAVRDA